VGSASRPIPRLPAPHRRGDIPLFFAEQVACPHSVVTVHLVDEAGQPTIAARDEIPKFFAKRLGRRSLSS